MTIVDDRQDAAESSRLDPEACVRAATDNGAESARVLLANHVCLIKNALAPSITRATRSHAENKMATTWGGNYFTIFADRTGSGQTTRFKVDLSIILDVLRSSAMDVARHYFEQRCGVADILIIPASVVVRKFTPRHPITDDIRVPFHQDASGFPSMFRVLNCWRLMSPDESGRTSPGLEFVRARIEQFIAKERNPTSANYQFVETCHAEVDRLIATFSCWQPSVALGDILMFDELALHRTYLSPSQTHTRHSAEIRLVARTRDVLDYLAVNPSPAYHLIGDEITGPLVMEQREGTLHEVRSGRWKVSPVADTLGSRVLRGLRAPLERVIAISSARGSHGRS